MDTLSKEEAFEELKKACIIFGDLNYHTDGFRIPSLVTPKALAELANLTADPSDVWIATYPKAGTTWTQQIVKLLRSKGEKDGIELQQSIPWAEANRDTVYNVNKVDLSTLPKPRAFKTHMPYNSMPLGKPETTPGKYIYVARNPKDVVVSFYFNFCRLAVKGDATLDFDIFFRNYIYGNLVYGDFFDHVLGWWSHRNDDNVLFLFFEDMKRDPQTAVVQIARFIGTDYTDDIIDKVLAATAFNAMKSDKTTNYSFTNSFAKPGSLPFMRKGEVGDWKNHFTPEQSAEIDKLCQERLKDAGLMFDFGE